ncbi:hypothetical protein [Roseivirga spongicola]|uniref:hypothetical protein n=1 Tax=Roseivirga spongicola TaxID=333140 RepID=UPI002AC8D3C6|nr:hypothetical protein [Roseivirga spongicola]WPZ09761.1 hypothetical protein T7867_15970 [Roseivirga spongicola]
MNWVRIFNRLWEIINTEGNLYFGGPRFINVVREVDPYHPDYYQFLEQRNQEGLSTSRRNYFSDILMSFNVENRITIVNGILDEIQHLDQERCDAVRAMIGGAQERVPLNELAPEIWNAERLNRMLGDINQAIAETQYERAVTLSYTALEGFYRAFIHARMPDQNGLNEIIQMSRAIRSYLRDNIEHFPDEAFNMFNHVSHTIDRTRNGFGEAHFGEEAALWLANYTRDLVNTQIRLLLHFM